ncbi:cell division protein SepF [Lederbergia citrea]|uniref:Cell division protein SepF n=1 Tax=Lederbergia citrea TaxID=2833581 RepID=A0A942UHH2_9BACI|nr:cell division protein SepF [Lederbergia citrea]MBS4177196.1 cell division protein SepF [Lederbergia citrea]MBS4203859.1 cell division protein SepF [Lederbergia citrea]MBS4221556.1 cell division protein SepF [Lederbergia citrea]
MGIKSKFKNFFLLEDEYDEYEEEEKMVKESSADQEMAPAVNRKQNVVSLQSVQKSSKVILIEPRVYAEAQEVADHLVNRRAVLVNLQRIQHDQAVRIVDFLSGAVYSIGGDIQRVGRDIFLCTPDNVEVSGNISELMEENDYHDTRWT